jgi:two-component system, response regulator PdtaR
MHVLIIEDEFIVALAIQAQLEAFGYESFDIEQTEVGAVEAADRRRPDFISADIGLKEGDGISAVGRIQDAVGPIPTIYVTASGERLPPDNGVPVVDKPFTQQGMRKAWEAATGS